jgi:hypothetical protein
MPIYDSMTAGYYIVTNSDISVIDKDNDAYYIWGLGPGIDFHALSQLDLYPNAKKYGISFPKFINRWSIETPPGYSCLFVNPMHNPSEIFSIMEGIVDTDKYINNIHFPFALNDPKWRGIIPAGTIIAQVIPFKRDNWQMSIGNSNNILKHEKVLNKIKGIFFEAYKNFYRSEKEFK